MVSLGINKDMVLADCPPDKAFWFNNGVTCRNIHELADIMTKSDTSVFAYYVNKEHDKNDFAEWIRLVLGDTILAKRLEAVKDKKAYLKIIKFRIKELKSM